MITCDLVLVGVGGQGVLTIGDLLLRSAFAANVPASFCPTKGMAQRGGFVKVEIRLGQENVGPRIGERGADLVVGMERSEALEGIRFVNPEGTFILFDHVWEPTGAMLGTDPYPTLERVTREIRSATATVIVLDPADLPSVDGQQVQPNVYVLGAMLGVSPLGELPGTSTVERILADRWPTESERNVAAFRSGLESTAKLADSELRAGGAVDELG